MWQFPLITNAILLSKRRSSTPEEKERRQRQLEYEAQEWQRAKAYNRTWKGFLHRMLHWLCGSIVLALLVDLLGATSPDQLHADSLLSLIIYAHRILIHEAYLFFELQPLRLLFCAFSCFFLIEIPRQILYAIERHKASHQPTTGSNPYAKCIQSDSPHPVNHIDLRAGNYKINVYLDGELIHSFDDRSGDIITALQCFPLHEESTYLDELIDEVQQSLAHIGKRELTTEEIETLKTKMLDIERLKDEEPTLIE